MEDVYQKQAKDFMEKWNVKINIIFSGQKLEEIGNFGKRNVNAYRIIIKRNKKQMTIRNWCDSLYNTEKGITPTFYDILSTMQKTEVMYYEDFCDEYGYEQYNEFGGINRESEKTYLACLREWKNVERVFGDNEECLQELQDIQ